MGAKAMDWFVWVGVDTIQAAACRQGRWLAEGRVTECAMPDPIDALGRVAARLAPLKGEASTRLWVAVADVHVYTATLPWTPLLMRDALLPSLVLAQLAQAGHEPGPRDALRVGEGAFGHARVVVGYPQTLLSACEGLAVGLAATLASVLPLSALAWQQLQRQGAGGVHAGVLADGMALLLQAQPPGGRHLVRVGAWPHPEPQAALRLQWCRWRLRAQVGLAPQGDQGPVTDAPVSGLPGTLPVLDWRANAPMARATAPAEQALDSGPQNDELSWLPALQQTADGVPSVLRQLQIASRLRPSSLDAVVRAAAATPLRWAALVGASLVFLGLALDNASTWQDRQAARAATRPDPVRAEASALDPAWSREELARIQQVNDAVRRLNLPLERLWLALQPPPDIPVALLSVDIRAAASGGRSVSQIRAQAALGQDMSRYVAYVAGRSPFVDAQLKQHERREGEPGQPYQFTMEAAWPQ
jgi:hypothetical protein